MRSGTFAVPPMERVYFGRPFEDAVLEEVDRLGAKRVFLLVSNTLNRTTDEIGKVRSALGDRYAATFDAMPPHIPRDAVLRATEVAREARADLVVTIGGGSVTDAGKNVVLALEHDITTLEGFEPFRLRTDPATGKIEAPEFRPPGIRQVAAPTTLSGGEFHQSGGSNDPVKKLKQSIRNPFMIPIAVVLDPALTLRTPHWLWLSTGMRSIDHAVEAFCAPLGSPFVDGAALQALRILPDALRRSKADPADVEARAVCQTGMWLAQTGMWSLVPMGASHGIGHVLAGSFAVPHGHCTCVTLPSVLRWNAKVNAAKQTEIAAAMGEPTADAADLVAKLIADLEMPSRLSQVGVAREDFGTVARNGLLDRWVHSNPRRIESAADILEILEMAA